MILFWTASHVLLDGIAMLVLARALHAGKENTRLEQTHLLVSPVLLALTLVMRPQQPLSTTLCLTALFVCLDHMRRRRRLLVVKSVLLALTRCLQEVCFAYFVLWESLILIWRH